MKKGTNFTQIGAVVAATPDVITSENTIICIIDVKILGANIQISSGITMDKPCFLVVKINIHTHVCTNKTEQMPIGIVHKMAFAMLKLLAPANSNTGPTAINVNAKFIKK